MTVYKHYLLIIETTNNTCLFCLISVHVHMDVLAHSRVLSLND